MRALALNCTLKRLPEDSNTAALTRVVVDALQQRGVETALLRVVDYVVEPGVVSEALSADDQWPALHEQIVAADILIVATPTWLGSRRARTEYRHEPKSAGRVESPLPLGRRRIRGLRSRDRGALRHRTT